jgi:hypothetical protein
VGGVALTGLNLGATFNNVPGGTATWSFTDANGNYSDASGTASITITKATASVAVAPYTAEYDGLPHAATVTFITGVNGESGATVGSVAVSPTHTSVGIYADSWSFTGASNYKDIASTPITDTIKDSTPPAVTASLVPVRSGDDDESTQRFTVVFSATDLVGVKTITATLNGVAVTNGQVVQLQLIKSGAQSTKRDDGKLQIKAVSFTLTVLAKDAAGNTGTGTAAPVFTKNGKDNDDDKKGSDKKSGNDK